MEAVFLKQMDMPFHMSSALITLHQALETTDVSWMVGGSCGLVLQGVHVDAEPRDLDVYADHQDTVHLHQSLISFSIDSPEWSETGMYKSLLSHYEIGNVQVELVGSLYVSTSASIYEVRVGGPSAVRGPQLSLEGISIPLMPLAHELIFNVLRNRPDRYEAIATAMRNDAHVHVAQLQELISANDLSPSVIEQLKRLIPEAFGSAVV
jgi:hypothetical protein